MLYEVITNSGECNLFASKSNSSLKRIGITCRQKSFAFTFTARNNFVQHTLYEVIRKDNLRIFNDAKPYSLVKLGALFPVAKDGKHYLIASRNEKGQASIAQLSIDTSDFIAKKPLDFTSDNVAKVAREFYSEPYGWGGSYECRDCSATTRDFMGVFGIFLPRNST